MPGVRHAIFAVGQRERRCILFRGAALIDAVPTAEPRVFHGLADAFGLREPVTAATLERLSDGFRPFRTWVCVLAARHLAKIGGWHRPGLGRERAALGRRSRVSVPH